MKLLLFVSLLLISWQAQAGCVASVCADGYTGCGCGEDSAECCRRRIEGSSGGGGGTSPGFDSQLLNQDLEMMQQNLQRQQQQQLQYQQMMQEGDAQMGNKTMQDARKLDAYHEQQGREQTEKTENVKSISDQLMGIDGGFRPLRIDDSVHQRKYVEQSEQKHGKKPDKPRLVPSETQQTASEPGTAPPMACKQASAEFPNQCNTTACGVSSTESLCCPAEYPYLNHCDCMCYESTDFACGGYSACQHYR